MIPVQKPTLFQFLALLISFSLLSPLSHADETDESEPSFFQPPDRYEAPPRLSREAPPSVPFNCNRIFEYREITYALDSFHQQDGERLRPHLLNFSDAVGALDAYQSNKQKAKTGAYIATAGVAFALLGVFVSSRMNPEGSDLSPASRKFENRQRNASVLRIFALSTGVAIAGGGVAYGFTVLHKNEENLKNAVEIHNENRPQDKIRLQLGATFFF
jgi:hypothetical protein